jgi:hypothetical protein
VGEKVVATTLEELEKRLTTVEQELADLRRHVEARPAEAPSSGPWARLSGVALADQATISAAVAKAFAEMGITGEPIGAEKVQEMIAACGIKPEDNEFSRGIIEMREE